MEPRTFNPPSLTVDVEKGGRMLEGTVERITWSWREEWDKFNRWIGGIPRGGETQRLEYLSKAVRRLAAASMHILRETTVRMKRKYWRCGGVVARSNDKMSGVS